MHRREGGYSVSIIASAGESDREMVGPAWRREDGRAQAIGCQLRPRHDYDAVGVEIRQDVGYESRDRPVDVVACQLGTTGERRSEGGNDELAAVGNRTREGGMNGDIASAVRHPYHCSPEECFDLSRRCACRPRRCERRLV